MALYTVNTNAKQEEALDFVLARLNAGLEVPITKNEFVQTEFREVVRRHLDEFRDFSRRDIGDLYADASPVKRSQVDAILKA